MKARAAARMGDMAVAPQKRWQELTRLLKRIGFVGVSRLKVREVKRLCRLYRHVTIDLSRARANGEDPELVRYLNQLAVQAHGQVYRPQPVSLLPLVSFVAVGFPRLVRQRAVPVLLATAIFFLTSLASWLAVVRDPEVAYSLFDEHVVQYENVRLEKEQGEYRGNFTFEASASPFYSALIIANNIYVSFRVFALGALFGLPGVLELVQNGRMLGTFTGLVWNHRHFVDFYSLILTHGVLELTAICIAGGGGLLLGWSLIAPGPYTRRDALRRSAPDAFGLLAGAVLLLIPAGLIEGHVTPHFSALVRWSVAGGSALFLIAYLGFAGRVFSKKAAKRNLQVAVDHGRGQA
jgi:uncharacterized membrane protein SpoIIM required for sporulation